MPFVVSHGRKIYYERHGQGPALLFCDGAGSNAATWRQQRPQFARGFSCITMDLRCFGRSVAPLDEFEFSLFVADAIAVLDAESVERAAVIGQSLGEVMPAFAQQVPGSALHVVQRAGHSAHFEQPGEFNENVLAFCNAIARPDRRGTAALPMDHDFSRHTLPATLLPLISPLPHAGAASVQQLEQRSFNAWPAPRNAVAGDWLLRSAGGYTKRANSANALQPGATLTPQLLEHIEAHYARQQLPSIFRLSPLADGGVDALLAANGYRLVDPSLLMQRATQAYDRQPAADGTLQFESELPAPWLESYCAASVHPPEQQLPHRHILESIGQPCAYASLQRGGRAQAWGLAVLERDAAGLYEVLVHPDHRGQGLGRQMVQGLLQWAALQGATHTDLQVAAANSRARQLYESLGFATVYGYHYRVKP